MQAFHESRTCRITEQQINASIPRGQNMQNHGATDQCKHSTSAEHAESQSSRSMQAFHECRACRITVQPINANIRRAQSMQNHKANDQCKNTKSEEKEKDRQNHT